MQTEHTLPPLCYPLLQSPTVALFSVSFISVALLTEARASEPFPRSAQARQF